jgi:hypothetical protein
MQGNMRLSHIAKACPAKMIIDNLQAGVPRANHAGAALSRQRPRCSLVRKVFTPVLFVSCVSLIAVTTLSATSTLAQGVNLPAHTVIGLSRLQLHATFPSQNMPGTWDAQSSPRSSTIRLTPAGRSIRKQWWGGPHFEQFAPSANSSDFCDFIRCCR